MRFLDLTLSTPEHNLACDEALLHWCEESGGDEILRVWAASHPFAVVGYGGKVAAEVNLPACRKLGIAVLRRCSGGGAVVQGPGCLNYALVLRTGGDNSLHRVPETNRFVLERVKQALEPIVGPGIEIQGSSDLALQNKKFSGNAQYRKRRYFLFHGTALLHFDISLIEKLLPMPAKQPAYRKNRPHENFLTNLMLPADKVKKALRQSWSAGEKFKDIPFEAIERLARERYSKDEWNLKF